MADMMIEELTVLNLSELQDKFRTDDEGRR